MGLFSKDIQSMEDLFLHTLQDIYYAENQIVKSLPKMIEKVTNRNLSTGLRDHLRETESQVMRLDSVFRKLGQEPKGTDCPAIDGLIGKQMKSPAKLRTRRSLMPRSLAVHRRLRITRFPATAPSSHGLRN
jgi:hypothetical protein